MPTTAACEARLTPSVDSEFLELVMADEELVRAEFDAIVAHQWADRRPPGSPPLRVPATGPPPGQQRVPGEDVVVLRRRRHPGAGGWRRQRSPPRRAGVVRLDLETSGREVIDPGTANTMTSMHARTIPRPDRAIWRPGRGRSPISTISRITGCLMATERNDLYAALGLTPQATQEQIRRAYRALMRQNHPDTRTPADPADPASLAASDSRLRDAVAAYKTLGDPVSRAAYDQLTRPRARPAPAHVASPGGRLRLDDEPPIKAGPVRWHRGPTEGRRG